MNPILNWCARASLAGACLLAAPLALADAVPASVSPAVALPMVGAPGATALTVKVCVTVAAAFHAALPAWSASMVQVPALTKVSAPAEVIVHTPVVDELKLTVSPESEVAPRVGVVPKL